MREMNLAEAMALAVLRGDMVAAYALADQLLEQRQNPDSSQKKAAAIREQGNQGVQSYMVYHSPEFQALCKRFGILHDLPTIDLKIELPVEGVMKVTHYYHGSDVSPTNEPDQNTGG